MRQAIAAGLMTFGFALVMTTGAGADYVTGLDPNGDNYLSLRRGPGTNYAEITRLGPDTRVTVIASEGSWRRVRLDDGTDGWAAARYLAQGDPPERDTDTPVEAIWGEPQVGEPAVVSGLEGPNARLPLRDGPSRDAAAIARLPNGTAVIVLGAQGAWYRVVTEDGEIGWLRGRFLFSAQVLDVPPPTDDLRWTHWSNARFGMAIDYPTVLFRPEPAPENGDGQSFITPDGGTSFFVFGQWNAMDLSLEDMHEMDLGTGVFGTVKENRLSVDSYVIAGQAEERITYRRALMPPPGDLLYVFEIGYPAAEAKTFGPVVERMSASFRVASRDDGQAPSQQSPGTPPETGQDWIRDLLTAQLRGLLERLP